MGIIEIKKATTELEARQGNGVLLYGRLANSNQVKAMTLEPVNIIVESNDVDEVTVPTWVQPITVAKTTNRVMEDVVEIPSFVGPRHRTIVTRTANSNVKRKDATLAGLIKRTVTALIG